MDISLWFQKKLRIEQIEFASLVASPQNFVNKVIAEPKFAVHIKNVLSKEEVANLKSALAALPDQAFEKPHPGAKTYPPACSTGQLDKESLEAFFKRSEEYNHGLENKLGVDLIGRFSQLMKALNGGREAILSTRRSDGATYVHGTVRYIEPDSDQMGLTAPHTGFDYAKRNANFSYAPLTEYMDIFRQISVFMVIQRPEKGGHFTLFNYSRSEYHDIKGLTLKRVSNGKQIDLFGSKRGYETIELQEGDAFLFADFDRWHRVDPLSGPNPRISYGCWAAIGNDGELYYWS